MTTGVTNQLLLRHHLPLLPLLLVLHLLLHIPHLLQLWPLDTADILTRDLSCLTVPSVYIMCGVRERGSREGRRGREGGREGGRVEVTHKQKVERDN